MTRAKPAEGEDGIEVVVGDRKTLAQMSSIISAGTCDESKCEANHRLTSRTVGVKDG